MTGGAADPLALLSRSDRARLEKFALAARTDATAMAAALIESGLAALRQTRAGIDGASAVQIARRARQVKRC